MRYLCAGPAHISTLRSFFKSVKDAPLSRQFADKRLKKLVKQGRIYEIVFYGIHGKKSKYFTLTELGAVEITKAHGIPREHIRVIKPTKHRLHHELMIADIIRTLEREMRQGLLKLAYMFDDSTMRQIRGTGKGTYYPDLQMQIDRMNKTPIPLYLEYDGGSRAESYWVEKIKDWEGLVLILCDSTRRMEEMCKYVINSVRMYETGLGLYDEFITHGMSGTEWYWVRGRYKSRINL